MTMFLLKAASTLYDKFLKELFFREEEEEEEEETTCSIITHCTLIDCLSVSSIGFSHSCGGASYFIDTSARR